MLALHERLRRLDVPPASIWCVVCTNQATDKPALCVGPKLTPDSAIVPFLVGDPWDGWEEDWRKAALWWNDPTVPLRAREEIYNSVPIDNVLFVKACLNAGIPMPNSDKLTARLTWLE